MALAQDKQQKIVTLSKDIEERLSNKYKSMDKNTTFGSKVKFFQAKNLKNQFLIDALWTLVKMRNHVVHDNEFKISLKEYELFLSNYEYVTKFIK